MAKIRQTVNSKQTPLQPYVMPGKQADGYSFRNDFFSESLFQRWSRRRGWFDTFQNRPLSKTLGASEYGFFCKCVTGCRSEKPGKQNADQPLT